MPAPGDIVFCNSDDDSTIGVVTAALLDDLLTVLMPTQHTPTFSLSDLSLAEEIIDTDNGTTDVGGDTEHTPAQSTNQPQMLPHHLQVTMQHVISLLTSHTLSL